MGLEVAEPKTKAQKVSREERTEDYIDLGGYMLEELDRFKYLGSIVQSDARIEEEIDARIAGASKCSWALKTLIKSRYLTRTTKIQIYKSIIRPVATYGCECWALTKDLEHRLLVFEHSILRRILGPVRDAETGLRRIRHNHELRDITQLPPI